jgi:hypothetical protein
VPFRNGFVRGFAIQKRFKHSSKWRPAPLLKRPAKMC